MWVRSATKEDLDAVRDMLALTWHATYDDVYGVEKVKAITDRYHSLDALKKQLAKPYSEFIIADDGADIHGNGLRVPEGSQALDPQPALCPSGTSEEGCGFAAAGGNGERLSPVSTRCSSKLSNQNQRAMSFYESRGFERTNNRIENWGEPNSGYFRRSAGEIPDWI